MELWMRVEITKLVGEARTLRHQGNNPLWLTLVPRVAELGRPCFRRPRPSNLGSYSSSAASWLMSPELLLISVILKSLEWGRGNICFIDLFWWWQRRWLSGISGRYRIIILICSQQLPTEPESPFPLRLNSYLKKVALLPQTRRIIFSLKWGVIWGLTHWDLQMCLEGTSGSPDSHYVCSWEKYKA